MNDTQTHFEELVRRHLEGTLDAEGLKRLRRMLEESPERRGQFAQEVRLHVLLGERFSLPTDRAEQTANAPATPAAAPRPRLTFRAHASWLALAAALVLIAGLGWRFWKKVSSETRRSSDSVIARVVEASGKPREVRGDRKQELRVGDDIRTGARIETDAGGRVTLAWVKEDTRVELSEFSELSVMVRVSSVLSGQTLDLRRGHLSATVAKQPDKKPWIVQTPQATLTVVGTRFTAVARDGRTRLEVTDGLVNIESRKNGWRASVAAGSDIQVSDDGNMEWGSNPKKFLVWRIRRRIPVAPDIEHLSGIAFDGTSLWVGGDRTIHRVDPDTGTVLTKITVPPGVKDIARLTWDGTYLWTSLGHPSLGWRALNVKTGKWAESLRPRHGLPSAFCFHDGVFWAGTTEGRLIQVEPGTGRILQEWKTPYFLTRLACTGNALWTVSTPGIRALAVGDARDLGRIDLGTTPLPRGDLAAGIGDTLWDLNSDERVMNEIEVRVNQR